MLPKTTAVIRDSARLAVLRRLQLMDSPAEEVFDRLTRFAARKLGVPIALVNLLDEERQFFMSAAGMGELRELPIGTGVCSHAVATCEPLVLEDARLDPRFSENPIVTEHNLLAYIGVPLTTSTGHSLGTFCIGDRKPREWGEQDLTMVRNLAGAVVTEIELRLEALEGEPGNAAAVAGGPIDNSAYPPVPSLKLQIAWRTHDCLSLVEEIESAADWDREAGAEDLVRAFVANLFALSHTFWPGGRRQSDRFVTDHAESLRASFGLQDDSPLHWKNFRELQEMIRPGSDGSDAVFDLSTLTVEADGQTCNLKPIIGEIRALWIKITDEAGHLSDADASPSRVAHH